MVSSISFFAPPNEQARHGDSKAKAGIPMQTTAKRCTDSFVAAGPFGKPLEAQSKNTQSASSHRPANKAQGHSSGVFVVGLTMTVTALAALM